ncbi:MAG TPA: hypothetical protein VE244_00915 [Nitrososphaeraceae archaeon]|nr:hypothetical protein [Nitrososphaeraceae archaeon]
MYTWEANAVYRQTRRTNVSIASTETSNRRAAAAAKQRKICNTSIANLPGGIRFNVYVRTFSHDLLF